jgi:hypothetical protein
LLYGTPWAPVLGDYVPTVAAVLPARLATGFGRFIAERAVLTDHNDLLLKRYLDTVSVPRLITTPNLSDHLPLPSLEGNVTPDGRRSVCFIKRGGAVDWTRPPVDPPVVPYLTPTPPRRAVAFVRAGPSADPVIRPALTVLRERHVRLDFLSTEFEQARDEHTALIPHLDDILLELWRVAALLGVGHRLLIRTAARPVDIEQLLRQPLVAATLVSWADGLLEKRVTDDDRQTLSPELSTFFASGIVSGHRASPRAAVSSSRGVV